jgi:hypothetical protein
MKKTSLFAIAAAAVMLAGAAPALAHDRDNFSFGIVVGDGGRYDRGPSDWERARWRHERWERERLERERAREEWRREQWRREHYGYGRWHDGWHDDW